MSEVIQFSKGMVLKADEGLGLVFGWGIICTEKGHDYFDLQGDHIPHDVMLNGVSDFMENARVAKDMHTGAQIGSVVHSFPLTPEIAKAFEIDCPRTGWLVAWKPYSKQILKAFVDGDRTGFSIGGECSYEECPMMEAA